jgi:hypothetical protein
MSCRVSRSVVARALIVILLTSGNLRGANSTDITGKASDPLGLPIPHARITLTNNEGSGIRETETDEQGAFLIPAVRPGDYTILAQVGAFRPVSRTLQVTGAGPTSVDIRFENLTAEHDSVVIVSSALDPGIDLRNGEVYKKTLFERDEQLLESLGAGINAGQHEGGGKSLEIRRFGFNLDHGGVNGGLKVLVNDLPQNQASQGHGQGYLGALKALTPELVDSVSILNGPFSAEYGDFSGLGVVQIRTRESLPDELTWRTQAGSFDTYRTFLAYSPAPEAADAFVAYEGAYTNGPWINHGRYKRNNFTGNYTWHLSKEPSRLVLGTLVASQIATQLIFGSKDQHPDRRNPRFQCARDLGVTHLSVVAQHERHLKFFGQADQLFPHFELFFVAQNLGERRRSRIVGNVTKVGSIRARTLLEFSSSQLIDAMPACHLRHPRQEGHLLIFCLEDPVQLQKYLCGRILGIFPLSKEMPADPQNMAIMSYVDCT